MSNAIWKSIRLGEIAPSNGSVMPQDRQRVWNLSLEDIESHSGKVLNRNYLKVCELGSTKCCFDERHVLYSKLRPYLNKVVLPDSPGAGTSELIPLLPNGQRLDREFLAYYLRSPMFLDFAMQNTRGANLPRIAMDELWKHRIPVPDSLREQRRIVARIKECMERIEEIERLRAESMAERKRLTRSYYHETYCRLQAGRPTKKLGEFGAIYGRGTPSKKKPEFWNGSIPWISPRDMKRNSLSDSALHISEDAVGRSAAKLIPEGSVLFVVRGMILTHTLPVAINRVRTTINQDKAIIPSESVVPEFLATMMRGAEKLLLSKVEVAGHGTRRLRTEHWASIEIPILNLDEQRALIAEVQAFEMAAESLAHDLEDSDFAQLRESILRKAFAGEL